MTSVTETIRYLGSPKVAEALGINIKEVTDTITDISTYTPHWMEGVWKGYDSKFWSKHTIASKSVHINNEEDSSVGNLVGSSGRLPDVNIGTTGNFVCNNNNPVFCAIEFGMAFLADINVRKMNKPIVDHNNCDLIIYSC